MSKGLEALERLGKALKCEWLDDYKIIEKELTLLEALRNKLDRKVKSKEYKHELSNTYRLSTLLTYECKEQWYEKEIECLRQFLLNLSGISKELKALDIIKEILNLKLVEVEAVNEKRLFLKCGDFKASVSLYDPIYDLLKEVLE